MADDEQTRLLTEIRDILRANYALSEKSVAMSEKVVGRTRWIRLLGPAVLLMAAGLMIFTFLRSR